MARKFFKKRKNFKRKNFKRKSYRKKKDMNKPTTMIQRSPGAIVADRYICKLKFQTQITFQGSLGVQQRYFFSGNSIWDPDQTSAGRTVVGFAELAKFYGIYHVYASSFKVNFVNGNNTTPYVLTIPAADPAYVQTSSYTTFQLIQQPYSKYTLMSVAGGGKDNVTLKNYISTSKILGFNYDKMDLSFSGQMLPTAQGSNPTIQWYWIISSQEPAAQQTNIVCDVVINYYVECFARRKMDLGVSWLGVTGPGQGFTGTTGPRGDTGEYIR